MGEVLEMQVAHKKLGISIRALLCFQNSSVMRMVGRIWSLCLFPSLQNNPPLGLMTAAWFKIHLNGDKGTYHDLIYGSASDSLCKYAEMKECMVEDRAGVVV